MKVAVEERKPVTIVAIEGSIDGTTATDLVTAFSEQVAGGNSRLVANLAEVDYMSSAGLRALLETVKSSRQHGGDLRLAGVRPDVLRVLDLSGFTSILRVFPDVESAVSSFAV